SGRLHDIPSATDCLTCHGGRRTRPLGFTALQLSPDRDPNAIHGEPARSGMFSLKTLMDERLLSPEHPDQRARPPRIASRDPKTRAVLGYLSTNCGSCHNGEGEIAAPGFSVRTSDLLRDGDAVVRTLIDRQTQWQIPGLREGASVLISPSKPD